MLHTCRYWPVFYRTNLGRVGTYLAAANDMAQVVNLTHAEFTLTKFRVQYMFTKTVKDTSKMTLVLIIASTVYQDIVKVHKYKAIQQIRQHGVHKLLKRTRCIHQTKW